MISNCIILTLIIWLWAPNSISNSLVYTECISAVPSVQASIRHFDLTFGEIFELKAAKYVSHCRANEEKGIPSCEAMKATKPLATIEGNIIRVPLT